MKKTNCEICGCELTDAKRSKSYKNRCKKCVAAETKEKRDQQKQRKQNENESKFIRPFKFRAQDFTHTWHIGYIVTGNTAAVLFPKMPDGSVNMMIQIYVLPETLTQFTGLYDKKGREIYEGDIIRNVKGQKKDASGNFVEDVEILAVEFKHAAFNVSCYALINDLEIIGNIFDNPELMESK